MAAADGVVIIMCGIIAYVGGREAAPLLLDGLRRLEYRGYDSAGIATMEAAGRPRVHLRKAAGRVDNLAALVQAQPAPGCHGISHTRWATHGPATNGNAHPHTDRSGRLLLVHNGVIENYQLLRDQLRAEGSEFTSDTDSEVLAHLIGRAYDRDGLPHGRERLLQAVRGALQQVRGTYGIAVMHLDVPGQLVGARLGSPLVVGLGRGEQFLASDVGAIGGHTREAVYLNDHDLVAVAAGDFEVASVRGGSARFEISQVEYTEQDAGKDGHPHHMLKEIFEQPAAIANAMRGRLSHEEATAVLGGLQMTPAELRAVGRVILTGCGSACHAAMVGEHLVESLARLPAEVEFASEFRYRNLPLDNGTLQFVISQSGETIDSLAALREGQRKGIRALGVVNQVASTIARESDGGIYMHAGPEIGVAATKTFTSQVTVLTLVALLLGRIHHLSSSEGLALIRELEAMPDRMREVLAQADHIRAIARRHAGAAAMLFLGRQNHYPVALEGALKMKEISYVYASGHPSAELKHGIIALVNPDLPSVFIAPDDSVFDKNVSNMEEVRARGGPLIAITTRGRDELERLTDDVIYLPPCDPLLSPLLTVLPLQLLAYEVAVARGCDVDKPRNLAKSVTVE